MTATDNGRRYRLVHVQNGREHVSAVVLGGSEVPEHLHAEAVLHQATGWAVYEEPGELVVAQRPGVRREVFARAFDPMTDSLERRQPDNAKHLQTSESIFQRTAPPCRVSYRMDRGVWRRTHV